MEKKLSELVSGEEGTVSRVDSKLISRLGPMGVIPGARIKLVRVAPLGDPLEFDVKGYALSIRKDACALVHVEVSGR
ncbi:MAG: FeoA family protein [Promethearchaeota archaeon]